ncbi:MFS transporter [Candidatus Curtissbacteria bacterium]|nr:MFS transporter [Candidatus Curtissbacteria bacterium]
MIFKSIPRQVKNLGLVSLFNDIASEMLYPVMPIFLTQVLAAPVAVVGIIEGVAEGSSAIFKTLFGLWSDKLGKRKIFVVFGYLSSAIAKVIIALSIIWPWVFLGRFVDRFGKGVRTGARDALLLEAADKNNKGLIFGFHRSMDSAGAVLGPLIGFFLLLSFEENIRLILYLAAIPSLFALFFLIFIKDAKKNEKKNLRLSLTFKNLPSQFKLFLLTVAIFSLGNSSDVFLILRAQNLGLTLSLVILAYVIYNFVYTFASTPAGGFSDKIGPKKIFWWEF